MMVAIRIPLSTSDDDMIHWFLAHGADPNARCDSDLAPTSFAMYNASLNMIERLFDHEAAVHHGQLLHHAVLRDSPDAVQLVRWLIDRGAVANEIKYATDKPSYQARS